MPKLSEEITHGKIGKGKIPVWAIGVGIAALIILYVVIRNRKKANTPVPATTSQEPVDPNAVGVEGEGVYGLPPGAIGSYLNNDPTNSAYPVGLTANGIPGPVTNVQWSRLAFDELVSKGDDPTLVANALAKFLSGGSLSQAENSIINLAQTIFGAPPEGVMPVITNTDPNPDSPTPTGTLSAPTGFRDTGAIWTDRLELHWNPVAGATGYVIRDVGAGTTMDVGAVNGVMKDGLVHNGTYFLQIAAKNAAGNAGPYSMPPITAHTKN